MIAWLRLAAFSRGAASFHEHCSSKNKLVAKMDDIRASISLAAACLGTDGDLRPLSPALCDLAVVAAQASRHAQAHVQSRTYNWSRLFGDERVWNALLNTFVYTAAALLFQLVLGMADCAAA